MPADAETLGVRPAALDQYGSGPRPDWLDTDWQQYERMVEIGGDRINFVDTGEGPAIVLLHGWSGRWQHWLDNILGLVGSHRVVAIDMPGFGGSEMPEDGATIQRCAQRVLALLDELEIDTATFVGSSMGGAVCVQAALEAPGRVEHLVLAAPTGLAKGYLGIPASISGSSAMTGPMEVIFRKNDLARRTAVGLVARPRLRRAALALFVKYPERLSGAICIELIRGAGREGTATATTSLASTNFEPRLPEIECPTLIVWGSDDKVVSPACAEHYARLIPNSTLRIYEDTGHLPMIERPARFDADLAAFVDG